MLFEVHRRRQRFLASFFLRALCVIILQRERNTKRFIAILRGMSAGKEMSVGEKVRKARQLQKPPVGLRQAASLVGIPEKRFQAVELNRSAKSAQEIIPKLSLKWRIPEDWFWDKRDTDPYKLRGTQSRETMYDEDADLVDVRLLIADKSGKVTLNMQTTSDTLKLAAGLAKNNPFAVKIADNDNAPRVKRGQILFFEPREQYEDGDLVAFDHPTEQLTGSDGKKHPVIYIRRFVHEDGADRMKPHNPAAETFLAHGLNIHGRAFVRRKIHADGWWTDEVNPSGLPWNSPE